MIHPPDILIAVHRSPLIAAEQAIRQGRERSVLVQELQRRSAKPVRGDNVSRKRSVRQRVENRFRQLGEIAGSHARCQRLKGRRTGRAALAHRFPRAKEEGFIPNNRAAESSAELVALERRRLGREKVPGVQSVISKEFEHASMKAVASRSRHRIHRCPAIPAVFRAIGARLDAELLNRIRIRKADCGVEERIRMLAAIQRVIVAPSRAAVYLERGRVGVLIA